MTTTELEKLVSELVVTTADRAVILDSLSMVCDAAYTKDASKFLKKLKATVPVRFFKPLELIVGNTEAPKELTEAIASVEAYISRIPVVHLTLGYEPTKDQIEQLANKLQQKNGSQVVVDYLVNPELIGLKIEFDGKIYEKSLETELTT